MTSPDALDADLVVVGSGVAGLTAAREAARNGLRVVVVTKSTAPDANTSWAQGGIAVVMSHLEPEDSFERHTADTVTAGAGLCDEGVVDSIVTDGPAAVENLRRSGARFDLDSEGRAPARTREGGHSARRVIHAGGDATGAEVERALLGRAYDISMLERHTAIEIVREPGGPVAGITLLTDDGRLRLLRAPAVLLATGGLGQLYRATSNPEVATGDGLLLALRAGADVADLEFVQFHPTVLFSGANDGHRPLVTEAVRGEGAVLVDGAGRRVMAGVHPLEDLAPRDVVSAAITRRLTESPGGVDDHVFLDATHLSAEKFRTRFPTVHAACAEIGIEPSRDPIPVAPAAHFACGGVVTSVDGRTSVPGLYAAGEVARTGLHGANRLASNSLLEGMVVGARAARAVMSDGLPLVSTAYEPRPPVLPMADRAALQATMSRYAAIGRSASGLARAVPATTDHPVETRRALEDAALTLAGRVIAAAAAERAETRGCHVRTDHPATSEAWGRSLVVRLDESGFPAPTGFLERTAMLEEACR